MEYRAQLLMFEEVERKREREREREREMEREREGERDYAGQRPTFVKGKRRFCGGRPQATARTPLLPGMGGSVFHTACWDFEGFEQRRHLVMFTDGASETPRMMVYVAQCNPKPCKGHNYLVRMWFAWCAAYAHMYTGRSHLGMLLFALGCAG